MTITSHAKKLEKTGTTSPDLMNDPWPHHDRWQIGNLTYVGELRVAAGPCGSFARLPKTIVSIFNGLYQKKI